MASTTIGKNIPTSEKIQDPGQVRKVCPCSTGCMNCYMYGTKCDNCLHFCRHPLVLMTWDYFLKNCSWYGREKIPESYAEFLELHGDEYRGDRPNCGEDCEDCEDYDVYDPNDPNNSDYDSDRD